jgi:hypothetical protein
MIVSIDKYIDYQLNIADALEISINELVDRKPTGFT